jgi:hypothetical protein
MRIGGERTALARFEVHHILAARLCADPATLEFAGHLVRFIQHRDAHAEGSVSRFGPADGLEDKINRRAHSHRLHLRGDVREHATLRRDRKPLPRAVDQVQQIDHRAQAVGDGIDPDHRIARAQH